MPYANASIKNILNEVPKEKHFRIHMGTDISNLHELLEALEIMSEETFNHHVNKNRNDFMNWINDVIEDKELAESLKNVKTKELMSKKIKERISALEHQTGIEKFTLTSKKINKFAVIDFAIGVAVGIIIGIILTLL